MTDIKYTPADLGKIARILANDNHEHRRQMLDFAAKDPIYIPRYDISLKAKRELALQRLRRLAHEGFISVLDFEKNPLRIFSAHEIAGMIDGSMGTKVRKRDPTTFAIHRDIVTFRLLLFWLSLLLSLQGD
jgi:acyl-CoA oxidase